MKNKLAIPSNEFLERYTNTIFVKDIGLPVVALKMNDDEQKGCPFVSSEGCVIYEDRPWSCRSFPLEPVATKDLIAGKQYYRLLKRGFCLGFNEDRKWMVREWKKDQGMDIYDRIEFSFKEITLSEVLTKERIVNEGIQQMFYMASYDIDRFKRFVFETRFLNTFDIEEELIEGIKTNEIELLQFGFRWLKFGLINKDTLEIKQEILKEIAGTRG
jgi:hypothetical protein